MPYEMWLKKVKRKEHGERKRDGTKTVLAENRPFYDG